MATGRVPLKIDRASQLDCPAKNPPCLRLDTLDCIFSVMQKFSYLVSEQHCHQAFIRIFILSLLIHFRFFDLVNTCMFRPIINKSVKIQLISKFSIDLSILSIGELENNPGLHFGSAAAAILKMVFSTSNLTIRRFLIT